MFDFIKIEGFRSFKKVALTLPRLAVLIGPNGGGKSNFLDLLMLMGEASRGELNLGIDKRGGFPNIAFGFGSVPEVRTEFYFKEVFQPILQPPFSSSPDTAENKPLDIRFAISLSSLGVGFHISEERLTVEFPDQRSLGIVKRDATETVFAWSSGSDAKMEERKTVHNSELAIYQVRDPNKYPAPSAILQQLQGWTFYRDLDVGPGSPVRQPALLRSDIRLLPSGSNLSSVLHAIQQDHPSDWNDILEILHTAYPDFLRLTVRAGGGDGKVFLRWFERPYEREGISANLLSDGTLKLLCLIAILKSPDPPPLICIDGPELGLHPDWIKLVAELLQDAAMRTQVIVATHSPHIVAKLEPEQLIVVEKEDGETAMKQFSGEDQESLAKWLKDFNLAELWLAGHFGGRP